MKGRIERVKDQILTSLSSKPFLKAIALIHHKGEDLYDPYFTLSFDVFYMDSLPNDRSSFYKGVELFEDSPVANKDRILIDNLPVRIEYKSTELVDRLLMALETGAPYAPRELSFLINRIRLSEKIHDSEDWFSNTLKKVEKLPEDFWSRLMIFHSNKMENCLNDLRAASMRKDPFFFHISLGNFLQDSGALLMALNHQPEPSPRYFNKTLRALPQLPDGFLANYESLLRTDGELTMERKSEVASLFTRSILGLLPSF